MATPTPETIVHLVYIHGFQGNDTSFQSFPTDLQEHLSANIPAHLNIKLKTSLYPTYKSRKAISLATQNFISWLSTQPPGPVILLAHSMGGLLAADAATDASNLGSARSRRILGVMAFDVPFLGLHPHVVVSGIASLFPADDDADKKTEGDMNQHSDVQIVDDRVTDDWEAFKKGLDAKHTSRSRSRSPLPSPSPSPALSPPPPQPATPFIDKTLTFLSAHADDPLVRWVRKHSDEPFTAGMRNIVEYFQFGSCMFDPSGLKERYIRLVAWPGGLWVNYWTQTLERAPVSKEGDEHARELDRAENDIALLQTRMASLSTVDSFSTTTSASSASTSVSPSLLSRASTATSLSVHTPSSPPSPAPALAADDANDKPHIGLSHENTKELKKLEKQRAKDATAARKAADKRRRAREKEVKKLEKQRAKEARGRSGHHFVVLPTGLGEMLGGSEKWERVVITVDDEVKAHCGLFIRSQNLDYEGLLERVGKRVLAWCEVIGDGEGRAL